MLWSPKLWSNQHLNVNRRSIARHIDHNTEIVARPLNLKVFFA
jgi:hypothetical protein